MKPTYRWHPKCALCKGNFDSLDIVRPVYGQKYSAADNKITLYFAHQSCKSEYDQRRTDAERYTETGRSGRRNVKTRKGWRQV